MKRFLPICLLLALILSGCSQQSEVYLTAITSSVSVSDTEAAPTVTKATDPTMPSTAGSESSSPVTTGPVTTESAGTTSESAQTTPETSAQTVPATSAQPTPETSAKTTPATSAETTPATSAQTSPATSEEPLPSTSEGTTSAPPVTGTPNTNTAPEDGIYREESAIVYAKRALTLYQNGTAVSVGADTALLCTGVGEDFARVRWLGEVGYVRMVDITKERPQSAIDIAAEKGGIYYKGVGPLIAIDAGHQDHSMKDTEPLGPGSSEMKAKLSSGTQGVATRLEEYKLNLAVSLLLRDELIARGYSVVMIRETNNVNMSNAERALIANAYEADAFIRIHANGSENSSARGAYALYQTKNNPYNGNLYAESKRLADSIMDKYIDSTGFTRKNAWETDTMTGINWATVPVTLIEMGYMSNADEDRIMATEDFQRKAALGMADGFDVYFGRG